MPNKGMQPAPLLRSSEPRLTPNPLAALADAVYRAIGVRMYKLPMSPGAILEALQGRDAQ